jgi:hypothetical protein
VSDQSKRRAKLNRERLAAEPVSSKRLDLLSGPRRKARRARSASTFITKPCDCRPRVSHGPHFVEVQPRDKVREATP